MKVTSINTSKTKFTAWPDGRILVTKEPHGQMASLNLSPAEAVEHLLNLIVDLDPVI